MTNKTLLIDGDWLCYKAAAAVETEFEWAEDQWTLTSDVAEATGLVVSWINAWAARIAEDKEELVDPRILLSDPSGHYFRHDIYPQYKGNRKGKRKPVCYKALVDRVRKHSISTPWRHNLEADDLMGIYATNGKYDHPVIVTIDKDLDTVPGWHYNPDKDKLYQVSPEEAKRNHMFQTLVGDATDGYKGCPGVGPVKASKILEARDREAAPLMGVSEDALRWASIDLTFEDAGIPTDEANIQAQLAYILQDGDYDFETGEVKLCQWM